MNRQYTTRLYFGQFPYKICFSRTGSVDTKKWTLGWNPKKCTKWLHDINSNFRIYTKVRLQKKKKQFNVKMSLFLSSKSEYDACLQKYRRYIESVTEPYSDAHVDLLKENTHIVLKKQLIYKKFRYVVNFRRAWHQPIDDIDDWVRKNFKEEIYLSQIKWVVRGYNPRVYLTKQEDLVLVKLTWGERIRQITIVHLLNELTV